MDNKTDLIEEWKIYKDKRVDRFGRHLGCLWEVSNYGRVKKDGEIIELKYHSDKFPYYKLDNYVHRIVVELFIGPILPGYQIDHIDGNPRNNRIDNLRIVTPKENMNNPITVLNHHIACNKESHKEAISKAVTGRKWNDKYRKRFSDDKKEYYKTHEGYWTGKEAHNKGKSLILCEDGKKHFI